MPIARLANVAVWVLAVAALCLANIAVTFRPGAYGHRARNLEAVWNGLSVILGLGDTPTSPTVVGARLLAAAAVGLGTMLYFRDRPTSTTPLS